MPTVRIDQQVPVSQSYRAARVKSLFNATDEQATRFRLTAELPIDDHDWRVGLIVGPSGSGKSSIGRALWPDDPAAFYQAADWPHDAPVIDAIGPDAPQDDRVATWEPSMASAPLYRPELPELPAGEVT